MMWTKYVKFPHNIFDKCNRVFFCIEGHSFRILRKTYITHITSYSSVSVKSVFC